MLKHYRTLCGGTFHVILECAAAQNITSYDGVMSHSARLLTAWSIVSTMSAKQRRDLAKLSELLGQSRLDRPRHRISFSHANLIYAGPKWLLLLLSLDMKHFDLHVHILKLTCDSVGLF